MNIKKISVKMIVSIMVFIAAVVIANNANAVITIEDSAPGTKISLTSGGHTDPWTGMWELLPQNVTRETPVGATFCMQKHQALRFTPKQAIALNGYKTETIIAHSELHTYHGTDVPATYARANVENNIKNELTSKLTDVGWGAAEVGTGDLARYGISDYDYTSENVSGNVVAVSKAYSKSPKYVGQGAEVAKNSYISYILSSGSYFHPINRFGLRKGNYAGTYSDTASGEGNAFLIQDSIWASHFNLAASNGINYMRTKPDVAVNLVKEAEDYEAYTAKLNNYKAEFVKTDAKVIANRTNNTYTVGPFKIEYPDDTRFSFIQEIYLIDENGNRIDAGNLKFHTQSGKEYPLNNDTFFIEIPGSVGDKYDRINVKADFAYLSLTYAEYERYKGTGDIGQILGIIETETDQHEYKDPVEHSAEYDSEGNKTKDAWTEHFYCTRYHLTGKFEEKIVGHYDPQSLMAVITVKRQWVEDYSKTYADKELIDLTTELGGYVWVDQAGGKEGVINGTYDTTEKRVPNIVVKLYTENGKFIKDTKTNEKGEYKFTKLNALKKYYVTFTYNGQYYEPTYYTSPYDKNNGWGKGNWQTNSNATDVESERKAFNERFAVIGSSPDNYNYNGSKQTFTKMELLGYSLNEKGEYVKTGKATIDEFGNLIDSSNGKMAQYVSDSSMTAHTGFNKDYDYYPTPDIFLIDNKPVVKNTYGSLYNMKSEANKIAIIFPDAYYINLGLHPRQEVDVAVNKDVEKVTVEINNKVREYKYDTLNTTRCNHCGYVGPSDSFKRGIEEDFIFHTRCPKCNSEDIAPNWDIQVRLSDGYYDTKYSRTLYKEDYAYKVRDYGEDFAKYGVSEDDELQVYVTYKIAVSNQSMTIKTRIDELVDYYDNDYELDANRSYIEINGKKYDIKFSKESVCGNNSDKISGLNKVYIRGIGKADADSGIYLDAGEYAYFFVTFRVLKDNNGYIRLDEDLNTGKVFEGKENIVELNGYSTRYNKGTKIPNVYDGKDGRPNGIQDDVTSAGIVDINSNPGNQTSRTDIRENDADKAPRIRIILNKEDQGRIVEGSIWEDLRNTEIAAALVADGKMDEKEERIDGVTVQLVELMDNPADDDHREFVWKTVSSGTRIVTPIINYRDIIKDYDLGEDSTGKYAFKSFIPGNYVIRFIYGDKVETVLPSSLGGSNTKSYNGQDYKSTSYQKGIQQVGTYEWREKDIYVNGDKIQGKLITEVPTFKVDYSNNETVKVPLRTNGNWNPINADNQVGYYYNDEEAKKLSNISDAKDIESRRNEVIDYSDDNVVNKIAEVLASHKEDNELTAEERNALVKDLIANTWMKAETGLMNIEIEYGESDKQPNTYRIENVNFGLEERPKADLEIQKQVSNVKVTLANGAILFDTNKQAQNVLWTDKLIQLTMDEEIMHGAKVTLDYDITVTNKGEVDYDDRSFYYIGVPSNGAKVVTTTPDIVLDYVANNLQFDASQNRVWKTVSRDEIKKNELVKKSLIDNKLITRNTIIETDAFAKELAPTKYKTDINSEAQNSTTVPLMLSQLITSENSTNDLTFRNLVEIVKTSNTVGRRDDNSIVGNQDPTEKILGEDHENDADESQVVKILPPFGSTPKAAVIAATILISIVIIGTGIIFIKKKVL